PSSPAPSASPCTRPRPPARWPGCSGSCCRTWAASPPPAELAAGLDMTPEKLIEVQKHAREPISLHTPLGEDGDSELGDLIEDSQAIQPAEAASSTLLQEQLHAVLGTPPEREADVVSMRFGLTGGQPKTLDEIGKAYGVTRERMRRRGAGLA